MSGPTDDFYVGYAERAPSAVRASAGRFVAAALLAGVLAAVLFALDQDPPGDGRYEFGAARTFVGRVESIPYPTLVVERPGATAPDARRSRYPVVGFAKFGAHAALAPFEGRTVRLEASLVHRDGLTLLELVDGSVAPLGPAEPTAPAVGSDERVVTVEGEIMDSKCFLGAMKPGQGRTHKACATLCVRGGIPPLLVGVERDGRFVKALLVGPADEALNDAVLELIAEPVRLTGTLVERDGLHLLRVDPAGIERLEAFAWI